MESSKTTKIAFWVFTAIVALPSLASGAFELFTPGTPDMISGMAKLGYPLYLMKILGFAKLSGALTLLLGNKFKTLKEWAYAGFTFDFLGALASHLFVGDNANAPAPVVFLVLLAISYKLWKKTQSEMAAKQIRQVLAVWL